MKKVVLGVVMTLLFSLSAWAEVGADTKAQGMYFPDIFVGVFWQSGITPDNVFDDQGYVPAVSRDLAAKAGKAWRKCQKQFNERQLASGARCVIVAELVTERPIDSEDEDARVKALRDLQTGVLVAFAATERDAMPSIVFMLGHVKGGQASDPHRQAAMYRAGDADVTKPGLFLLVAKEQQPQ